MAEARAVTGAQPRAYIAPHPVYTSSAYHEPNRVFVTSAPKGRAWKEVPISVTARRKRCRPKR